MIILAIDPGTERTGLAVWDTETETVCRCYTLESRAPTWQERVEDLANKLCYRFQRIADVDVCLIEEPASKQNYRTTLALGAVVGMVMAEAWYFFGCAVETVPSAHVKRWCRIRPGTRREQIKAWTRNVVHARLSDLGQWRDEYTEDEVDALALALYWADKVRTEEIESGLEARAKEGV